jgi:isocitrate dehydrogenase
MISNRGTKVYADPGTMPDCVDHWRCRFVAREASADLDDRAVFDLLTRVAARFRWMHVEKLQEFDGAAGYTKAQGED